MFTLKELGVSIASAPVTLRGKSRMVRKLSIAEQDAITRALPLPVAPVGPDRTRGSDAPFAPDYEDPVYRRELSTRRTKVGVAEACAALDLAFDGPNGPLLVPQAANNHAAWVAYCEAAWTAVAVQSGLFDHEINAVHKALEQLTGASIAEAARGNSQQAPADTPTPGSA